MFRFLKILIVIGVLSSGATTKAGVISFIDDYEGFLAAAGAVQTIGFEILPDGSPTTGRTEITPEFNYTEWGVTFSSPVPTLEIRGNPTIGFGLVADSYPSGERNWIVADFAAAVTAVGAFYPPSTYTISVFDTTGSLIASEAHGGLGDPYLFLGFVSETPLGSVRIDAGTWDSVITSFHFTPIPEPATLALLGIGGTAVVAGRNRRHRTPR